VTHKLLREAAVDPEIALGVTSVVGSVTEGTVEDAVVGQQSPAVGEEAVDRDGPVVDWLVETASFGKCRR
jgi:hypothetical protein